MMIELMITSSAFEKTLYDWAIRVIFVRLTHKINAKFITQYSKLSVESLKLQQNYDIVKILNHFPKLTIK